MTEIKLNEAALESAANKLSETRWGTPQALASMLREALPAYLSALPAPVGEAELVERVARAMSMAEYDEWADGAEYQESFREMARAAIAAMQAHLRTGVPDGWRDIASAPKDKPILVFVEATGAIYLVVWGSLPDDEWVIVGGSDMDYRLPNGKLAHKRVATHWKPLPSPPLPNTDGES